MPVDTLELLVGQAQQRVGPMPDYYLIVGAVVNGLRKIYRDRDWTFRRRNAQFLFHTAYTTGTVSITRGNNYGDFVGSTLSQDHVGRQLRAGGNDKPIVTINRVSGNRAYFQETWGAATVSAVTFEIYTAYVTTPSDFDSFYAIVDLNRSHQIDWWTLTGSDLDRIDPQRSHSGDAAYAMVLKDYAGLNQGVVGTLIQVRGSGNRPTSGGSYTGVSDAVFTIEMTSTTQFQWKKDSGSYVTGVAIDSDGIEQELQDGVTVSFPNTVAYTSGDVFVVSVSASRNSGDPRFEAWPHIKADECRPYAYICRMPDLNDAGAVLPRQVPGDLVLEAALEILYLALAGNPENKQMAPTYMKLAQAHASRYAVLLVDVIREDEAKESSMLVYDSWARWPTYDSEYLAGHDVGYELDVL